ncbi:hypothetical protein V6N11_049290 [Hibiscus sabdariffa]|uniref:Uncharacterized protein n=1 Tax=Hibiscus sabdariffa TaxID=183260 RepID=A0ABR2P0N0_9ROSI
MRYNLGSDNVIGSTIVGTSANVLVVLPNIPVSDLATSFVSGIDTHVASGDDTVAYVACNVKDPAVLDSVVAVVVEVVVDQCGNGVGYAVLNVIAPAADNDVVVDSNAELRAYLGNVDLQVIVNSNNIEFPPLQAYVQKKKVKGSKSIVSSSSQKAKSLKVEVMMNALVSLELLPNVWLIFYRK